MALGSLPGSHFLFGSKPIFFVRPCRTTTALPNPIGECRDILLCNLLSDSFGTGRSLGFLVLLLRKQVSRIGVLLRLSGAFMSSQVIFFSLAPGPMGVSSEVAVLSSYLL